MNLQQTVTISQQVVALHDNITVLSLEIKRE